MVYWTSLKLTFATGQVKVCQKLRVRNSTTTQLGSLMLGDYWEMEVAQRKDHPSTNIPKHNWTEQFGKAWKDFPLKRVDSFWLPKWVWIGKSIWSVAQQKLRKITVKLTGWVVSLVLYVFFLIPTTESSSEMLPCDRWVGRTSVTADGHLQGLKEDPAACTMMKFYVLGHSLDWHTALITNPPFHRITMNKIDRDGHGWIKNRVMQLIL